VVSSTQSVPDGRSATAPAASATFSGTVASACTWAVARKAGSAPTGSTAPPTGRTTTMRGISP
jgi:hypothetical protein